MHLSNLGQPFVIVQRGRHADSATAPPEYGTPEAEAFMGRWMAYNQVLIDGGHWVASAGLAPIDATDLDQARAWSASTRHACCR